MDEDFEVRSLSEEDRPRLGRPKGAVASIRAWHHRMAILIARGLTDVEVARFVDRTPPTVRNFRLNPANQELIAQYQAGYDGEVESELDYRARLVRLIGTMALEELADKLHNGEVETVPHLLALADSANDRMGLAKASISANINLNAGDRLAKARERVAELKKHKEIEGVVQGNVVKMRRW